MRHKIFKLFTPGNKRSFRKYNGADCQIGNKKYNVDVMAEKASKESLSMTRDI